MGNAIGPDVSFYQDEPTTPEQIDFVKMKQAADYVIVRAGQNLWPDSDFKYNWAEAKKARLPRGTYWFYDSRAAPAKQAELWVDLMEGDFGELPLFADFEEAYGGIYKGWQNWYNFLERLKELVDQKEIGIYTAYYYWRDNAPSATTEKDKLEYFHQYPLWIANYGVSNPTVPQPWGANGWLFWQYTENGNGKTYGVESQSVDLNYFNGDAEAFRQRFNLGDSGGTPPGDGGDGVTKYRVELGVRESPSLDANLVGTLQPNEIVEQLDATANDSWIQIKRADGTTGWIPMNYLIVEEEIPPETGVEWYKVTATSGLIVRDGPGTSNTQIGSLLFDEVVKALEKNTEGSWIKIYRESDVLTGWCSAAYLELIDSPTPPDDGNGAEPPDNGNGNPPDTDEWYKVTATNGLIVRDGPGTNNTQTGSLLFGEVVKALEKNADGSWIKIYRESDGLTGWCSATYLELTDAPAPPVVPPPEYHWYEVSSLTLNVREGPSTSDDKVGTLSQGDMLIALEENEDGTWVRIQRFDGLVGWCAVSYLHDLGTNGPSNLTQKIFSGVTYYRKELQSPRQMVAHILRIDMHADKLKCLVTPPSHESGTVCTRKTSAFLGEFGLQVAVNGDGFTYLDQDTYDPNQYCPNGGEPVKVNSYAASRGNVYSQRWAGHPILYINKNNSVTFNEPAGAIFNAVSGDRMLIEKGKVVDNLESQSVEPRTAAGTNQNGRWLYLIVIDGRQPGYSEGATFPELADLLLSLGVYAGLNLDGGGSSAMVIEGKLGNPFVLNSPIEGMIPGNESAVANHLGFWANK